MQIAYLPLDSRPCNARFPAELLALSGVQCIVPLPDALDYFTTPADPARTEAFLLSAARDAGTLLLSVDQLVYGSLLASREDGLSEADALSRLELIRTIKRENPSLRVLAFNILMRTSISALQAGDLAHYYAITEYSQARHRGDQAEAARLEQIIPAPLLAKYLRVRARNHAVNRACVALAGEGLLDTLLLLQEDSQPYGLHKLEQAVIARDIAALPNPAIVTLHNGTDEGGCLCAARAVSRPLRLHVHALGGESLDFIACYEDRPFRENIESHCRFAGIELTGPEEADKILCVLTPGKAPQADVPDYPGPVPPECAAWAEELATWIKKGKPVGLLDVYYANGGMLPFLDALSARIDPFSLDAYAAWNTASNALGTVLAQLALNTGNDAANQRFTAERLLDDLLYQSRIRSQLQAILREKGEDSLCLRDKAAAETQGQALLDAALAESPVFSRHAAAASLTLPWPRIFEAELTLTGNRRTSP